MLALASPASLKGVLTPLEAAAFLAEGMRRVDGVVVDEVPVADGGEGTAAVLEASLGGEWHDAVVQGPLGAPVDARWLVLPGGTAVVESSQAVGLPLLTRFERDPLRATTHGVGDLLLAAVADGARRCSSASAARRRWTAGRDCASAWGAASTASRSVCCAT